jgi:hypothetical protein
VTFNEINFKPDDYELRVFSVLWLVGFVLLGALVAWRVGAFSSNVPVGWQPPWRAAVALWTLAVVGSAIGLALPRAIKPVYIAWMVAAFPIGWTVSLALLACVYYVVFTAFGLVFRVIGRDPLGRSFDRTASTYWVPRRQAEGLERYFKQF